jgi:hypothetical protein
MRSPQASYESNVPAPAGAQPEKFPTDGLSSRSGIEHNPTVSAAQTSRVRRGGSQIVVPSLEPGRSLAPTPRSTHNLRSTSARTSLEIPFGSGITESAERRVPQFGEPRSPQYCSMRHFRLERWLYLLLISAIPLMVLDAVVNGDRGRGVRWFALAAVGVAGEAGLLYERSRGRL